MLDLLITNARLLDPASGLDAAGAVLVRGGAIVDVGPALSAPEGAETLDAGGACLAPGLVDLRANLGEPGAEHRESIASAAQAAAAGGSPRSACSRIPTRRWMTRRCFPS